jgi:hypothetical protein
MQVEGDRPFMLRRDKRYRVTIALNWFEQPFANTFFIGSQFAMHGFSDVEVEGGGARWQITARWTRDDAAAPTDPHLVEIVEVD